MFNIGQQFNKQSTDRKQYELIKFISLLSTKKQKKIFYIIRNKC